MNIEPWLPVITGIGTALVGLIGILLARWWDRRKSHAETRKTSAEEADILSAAAVRLADRWEAQVTRLEKRVCELEAALRERDKQLDELTLKSEAQEVEIAGLRLAVRDLSAKNAAQAVQIGKLEQQLAAHDE